MLAVILKQLRLDRAGFDTLTAAATALDVRHSAVSRWESGARRPTPQHLAIILERYGCSKRERDKAWAAYRAELEAACD